MVTFGATDFTCALNSDLPATIDGNPFVVQPINYAQSCSFSFKKLSKTSKTSFLFIMQGSSLLISNSVFIELPCV